MKHFPKCVIAFIAVTSLSGCAMIGNMSQSLWGGAQSFGLQTQKSVLSLLRPAPKTDYADASGNAAGYVLTGWDDSDVNYGVLARRHDLVRSVMPAPAHEDARQYFQTPAPRPQPSVQKEPSIAPGSDIAFVKTDGPSHMVDWQGCEQSSGGTFITSAAGYRLNPDFENCMRSRGYKPESEIHTEETLAGAPHTAAP